jgi:hypothetical protein
MGSSLKYFEKVLSQFVGAGNGHLRGAIDSAGGLEKILNVLDFVWLYVHTIGFRR